MKRPYFPIFIDISEKKIQIIGGGRIALRRVKTLLAFTEKIQVISPQVSEELEQYAKEGRIQWIRDQYRSEYLDGADIVLAATDDPACNELVAEDCRKRKIMVNVSHSQELCDFYFPAIIMEDQIVTGITSSGMNHEKVRRVREVIEDTLKQLDSSEKRIDEKL
ncbi:MAG: bifunctional precorrin-2 dehydrogenase/sirohydrochlorin ferrochelatase [Dorea sp.]|nr:bifunctional precorrin-2 dehydrogenase/sirohydrochlorin ferrochelatase [Dorea sp.]